MAISVVPMAEQHHDEAYKVSRAAWEADVPDIPHPSPAAFAAKLSRPWPGMETERWVAVRDGAVVGYLQMRMPVLDNLDNVELELFTDPGHRRRGVGRAMAAKAVDRTRALGRRNLIAATIDSRPDGGAFAVAMGARAGVADTRSRLDVPPRDQDRLDALLADARRRADGYRVVQWTGVPAEEFLDDVAYLEGRLFADAPTGELDMEPQKVDADRIRATDEHLIALGRTAFHTGAVHVASGRMIAWTVIAGADDTPVQAWQQITLVDPEHRGRRLGLLVKLENLGHIRRLRPELTGIDTFNASANRHMLAINETMGFRRMDSWVQWQLTL